MGRDTHGMRRGGMGWDGRGEDGRREGRGSDDMGGMGWKEVVLVWRCLCRGSTGRTRGGMGRDEMG